MKRVSCWTLAIACLSFSMSSFALVTRCESAHLYFYQQPVGTASTSQSYRQLNNTSSPMTILSITVNSPSNTSLSCEALTTDYSLGGSCVQGLVLMPGESCTVDLTFAPQALGPRNTIVTLRTNLGDRDVPVSGIGAGSDFTRPTKPAIEYVNPALNQYVMTSAPAEIAALDAGVQLGWVRTGATFNGFVAFNPASLGLLQMCRWYAATTTESTHWYFVGVPGFPLSCPGLAIENLYWGRLVTIAEEDPNVFYLMPPSAFEGWCPYATIPLYALYDRIIGHRYTVDPTIRADMIAKGWLPEGYGAGVVACVSQ